MALTFTQLKAIARHELGGATAATHTDADTTAGVYVNLAGRYLVSMHRWNSLIRPPADLDFTAAQEFVALPSDFGELEGIAPNENQYGFGLVTPAALAELRGHDTSWDGTFYGAVVQPGQTQATSAPAVARLELWPTPSANLSDALRITYRAGWTELSHASAVANLPEFFEPLLVEVIRAYAKGQEEGDTGGRLAAVELSPIFRRTKERDDQIQDEYGPIRNGAAAVAAARTRPWIQTGALGDPA